MKLRSVTLEDGAEICRIYNPYILETTITFEEEALTPEVIQTRIQQVQQSNLPWFVLEADHQLLGYAYASPWKARSAYRFTVETSIYVSMDHRRDGVGTLLYQALLQTLQECGIHSAIGILALPNPQSVNLHHKLGFHCVGQIQDAGFKFNQWIDVAYWQKML
jgi:phosphinothricin acetyltransferase